MTIPSALSGFSSALGALDAEGRSEFWAALALMHTKGIGGRTTRRLLEAFGSAFNAVRQVKEWKKLGIQKTAIAAFQSEHWRVTAKKEWNAARGLKGTILLWTDNRYPESLRQLPDSPVRLYCQGDLSLLENFCVAIVGTRHCSRKGLDTAARFATGLASAGITVVSGMAIGVDRQAHLSSVELAGSSIGVLGAGLDVDYPKINRDLRRKMARTGLLLSEYPPGTLPNPAHFPIRNRLISGLSLGVLVAEAATHSGSLITARLALEQNRTIYALAEGTDGCRELLDGGAIPVSGVEDILSDLHPLLQGHLQQNKPVAISSLPDTVPKNASKAPTPEANAELLPEDDVERRIVAFLKQGMPRSEEDLCQELCLSPSKVNMSLVLLEMKGTIQRLPNWKYTAV